jgi:hypothetical protein
MDLTTPVAFDPEPRPSCEERIAWSATPYGEMARYCGQVVGLRRWRDAAGTEHVACAQHESALRSRWTPETEAEARYAFGDR